MNTADVTLHQVLLMTRLRESGPCSISQLAETLGLSLPAGSQAIERLRRLGMVTRLEDPADRRRKTVATTKKAHALLDRLLQARSQEYAAGVAVLPAPLRDDLAKVLRKVLGRLP
ncbi:MAG: MarR family transcriptional regulator [bacterium]